MATMNRRDLIGSLLGGTTLAIYGCSRSENVKIQGSLLGPDVQTGHRLRDQGFFPPRIDQWREVSVVIVGGGIAGLSAAWRLKRSGFEDFQLLELESTMGGTSRCDSSGSFRYPWGAHYMTTPLPTNQNLIGFLKEMGIIVGVAQDGTPIVAEEYLCREPEERIFVDGQWHEGLFPEAIAKERDLKQFAEFNQEIKVWASKKDALGKRPFDLPIANGSEDEQAQSLDRLSMLDWLTSHGWDSPILRWYVDYACRDDYGLTIDQTSAWAGILYFAARLKHQEDSTQDVITWPAGNGQVVEYLSDQVKENLRSRFLVAKIRPCDQITRDASCEVVGLDVDGQTWVGYRAKRVIFAAPQFVAQRVIEGFRNGVSDSSMPFRYSWWLVANVHLSDRPIEMGFPLSWDNVFYDSKSLGYVVSTHQSGIDHGPCVWTWYYPFADTHPTFTREQLLNIPWSDWVEVVLTDLQRAHPKIRDLVTKVDIFRWGHAMVQPYKGFLRSKTRIDASKPDRNVHFANTDLSGVALLEEAFYHGLRAADEVLDALTHRPHTHLRSETQD